MPAHIGRAMKTPAERKGQASILPNLCLCASSRSEFLLGPVIVVALLSFVKLVLVVAQTKGFSFAKFCCVVMDVLKANTLVRTLYSFLHSLSMWI